MSTQDPRRIDAALARLPEWQPPPGFAMRLAALASEGAANHRYLWLPAVLRGGGIAACVSVGAWLTGELLAALLSPVPGGDEVLAWTLAAGSLFLAWHLARRQRLFHA